jgi:hypothetical protein
LHIKYTARDGGNVLKQAALQSLRDLVEQGSLYQMFSAKDEFSSDWHKFLYPQANKANELVLDLQSSRFRYYPANKSLSLKSIVLLMKLKLSENVTYDEANPLMYDLFTTGATGESSEVTNDADKHFKHAAFDGRTIDGLIQATPFTDQSPGKPLGKRLLRITAPVPKGIHVENNNANLDPEAVDDVLVVCEYSLKQ